MRSRARRWYIAFDGRNYVHPVHYAGPYGSRAVAEEVVRYSHVEDVRHPDEYVPGWVTIRVLSVCNHAQARKCGMYKGNLLGVLDSIPSTLEELSAVQADRLSQGGYLSWR